MFIHFPSECNYNFHLPLLVGSVNISLASVNEHLLHPDLAGIVAEFWTKSSLRSYLLRRH